ncbi:hypothetical protein EBI_25886 [Enterocytozoon bieneusi H348]|nr:hypothetical protein EBI_25886 [Enterocytozoon bieneusi H348]|eukprot:XP_001828017.1 hypothetical protein EBI_25886 [Enterocytozoon bieneusi H348]
MRISTLQKNVLLFILLNITKTILEEHILQVGSTPSWVNLISSTIPCIISGLKYEKLIFYDWKLIIIGLFIAYDNFIKLCINQSASSNLKEIVSQNAYMVFGNIINIKSLGQKYNLYQIHAMIAIAILGIGQLFYPYENGFNLTVMDLFNFIGSLLDVYGLVLFKKYIEFTINNKWNYSMILCLIILLFSLLFFIIDIILFESISVIKTDFLHTLIFMILTGCSQILLIQLSFSLNPFSLLIFKQVIEFCSCFFSDLINNNYTSTFQFMLAFMSVLCCNTILLFDDNNNNDSFINY